MWFFSAAPFFSLFLCSGMDPPWAAVPLGISALPRSTYFSSDLGVCTAGYCSVSTSSLLMWCFLFFVKYVFTEVPPISLMGSAVPCGTEPAGTGRGHHGTARGLFSWRSLLQSTHCQQLGTYTQYRCPCNQKQNCLEVVATSS